MENTSRATPLDSDIALASDRSRAVKCEKQTEWRKQEGEDPQAIER